MPPRSSARASRPGRQRPRAGLPSSLPASPVRRSFRGPLGILAVAPTLYRKTPALAGVWLLPSALLRNPVGACPGHTVTGAVLSALAVDAAVDNHRHLEGELLHPVAAGKPQGDGATAVIGGVHIIEAQRVQAILAGVALGSVRAVAADDPPQVVRDTLGRGDDKVAVPVDHCPGQANAILRRRQSLDRLLDVLRDQALNVFGQKIRNLLSIGALAVRAISAAL